MAFDPDKYLSEKGFDPDAYLAEKPPAAAQKSAAKPDPSDLSVGINAADKAIAGLPDAILNTPTNLLNLGKAAFGAGATAFGRPDLAPELTPNPNLASRAMRAMGFTRDSAEPANARQRMIDTIVQGAVGTAISPASSGRQLATNAVTGALGGMASEGTQAATGNDALAMTAAMLTPSAVNAAGNRGRAAVDRAMLERRQNEVADATHADARRAGYVFPPAETNPSFINKRLTSLAGKAATDQEAASRNQGVTNRLAANELGMPNGTAITEGRLEAYRNRIAQPYRDVAAIDPHAAQSLQDLRDARFEANAYHRFYERSADPNAQRTARAADARAATLENLIEGIAQNAGQPQLVNRLRDARRQIAKSYDIERSLNLGDAGVSAPTLGRALDRGAPLTDGLETIARTNQAFPNQTREGAKVPTPGVSKSEAIVGALLGAGGAAAAGPVGLTAAGLPLLSGPARSLILSEGYQNMMANPNRNASRTNRVLAEIPDQSAAQQAIQAIMLERALAERK